MVIDPVCGMEVDPEKSNWVVEIGSENFFFCSESCQKAFIRDPLKYSETRHRGHNPTGQRGHMGGCCGAGTGGSWLRYVYIAITIFLFLLLFYQ